MSLAIMQFGSLYTATDEDLLQVKLLTQGQEMRLPSGEMVEVASTE